LEGIRLERASVHPLRDGADLVIDTSNLTVTELKRVSTGHFTLRSVGLQVFVTSLSFRQGIPCDADLIFDVRFIDNPDHVSEPSPLSALHPGIIQHIEYDRGFGRFFPELWQCHQPLLPRFDGEGKAYPTIGIGCTGERHRAVCVAEGLTAQLRGAGVRVELSHGDVLTSGAHAAAPAASAPALAS
jgi:UPF0042 nucleotide-binding protein